MAGAAWRLGVARMRSSWRAYASIAVLVGITAGLSLFAIAGARRTQSSYPRFLEGANASTISVTSPGSYDPDFDEQLASFPEVERASAYLALEGFVLDDGGRPDFARRVEIAGTIDGRFLAQDRFTPTAGRMYDPAATDEVVVNEVAADSVGFRAGETIELGLYDPDQTEQPDFFADPDAPRRTLRVRIVGVGLFPDEVLQDDADRLPRVLVTPTLTGMLSEHVTYGVHGLVLRRGDADVESFRERLDAITTPGTSSSRLTSQTTFHAQQAMQPAVLALGVFGAMTGVAGLVLSSQAIAARRRIERDDDDVLRALGASDRDLAQVGLALPMFASAIGAAIAVAVAIAMSPLMPVGAVRRVEPDPGVHADALVLAVGVAVILVVPSALSLRRRRAMHDDASVPNARKRPMLTGARPTVTIGLSHALATGRGGYGTGRAVIVGAVVAISTVVAAITFGACLARLTSSPPLYGWDWDAAVVSGEGYGNIDGPGSDAVLRADPDVDMFAGVQIGSDSVDGMPVPLLGMAPDSELIPPMVRGRMIRHGREIVLGASTAASLGKGVGDSVEMRALAGSRATETLTVAGIATFPTIGRSQAERTSLGVGAIVVPERVPGFDLDITGVPRAGLGPNVVFVRFVEGADVPAAIDRLAEAVRPITDFAGIEVVGPQRPAEIVNADAVGRVPLLLGGLLALGAATSLALAVGAVTRTRRRELAILKAIGFTTSQIASTVSWHATATAVIGIVAGVPAGVVAGRAAWSLFAQRLDVISEPALAPVKVAIVAVGALLVANIAAALPARRARRVDPAAILRSE